MEFILQLVPETLRQADILHHSGFIKQWGNILWLESGNATTYWSYKKMLFGMSLCVTDKLIDIRTDGIDTSLHGRYAVALSLHAYPLPHSL